METHHSNKKSQLDQLTFEQVWMMMEEIEPLTPLCSRTQTSSQHLPDPLHQ